MSDLNDYKLGGYHNAGGHIRDGTGAERVRPMSDEQAFVDALELPNDADTVLMANDEWRIVFVSEQVRAFAVTAITAYLARPLPEVDEIMRLADVFYMSPPPNNSRIARAALEAAVRQQAARIVELEQKTQECPICETRFRDEARIATVSEPLPARIKAADAQRNSQDGNSVVLDASEWDAYRADLNAYSAILSLLGMDEEGDAVAEVKRLLVRIEQWRELSKQWTNMQEARIATVSEPDFQQRMDAAQAFMDEVTGDPPISESEHWCRESNAIWNEAIEAALHAYEHSDFARAEKAIRALRRATPVQPKLEKIARAGQNGGDG